MRDLIVKMKEESNLKISRKRVWDPARFLGFITSILTISAHSSLIIIWPGRQHFFERWTPIYFVSVHSQNLWKSLRANFDKIITVFFPSYPPNFELSTKLIKPFRDMIKICPHTKFVKISSLVCAMHRIQTLFQKQIFWLRGPPNGHQFLFNHITFLHKKVNIINMCFWNKLVLIYCIQYLYKAYLILI